MKVAVVGTGYVGLVAGTCFADSGNTVICVDNDPEKIRLLKKGRIPIYEPGLAEMVQRNSATGRLRFTTDLSEATGESEIIFIAVGTPPGKDGSADLSAVYSVTETIAGTMDGYRIIVNKSTVPVGTADAIRKHMRQYTWHEFDVVSNPEFMKEGAALEDFLRPERVVIGTDSLRAAGMMEDLYSPFLRTGASLLTMDNHSAEMVKYASNAMLASRISFMNEMANICVKVGADVGCVRRAVGLDSRIGSRFLFPGAGYGGSCFPKDVQALIATARENGYEPRILVSIEAVNNDQKHVLGKVVKKHFGKKLSGKTIAVWGLAFKPQTDDMREAASIVIINDLIKAGATVQAYDPVATESARKIFGTTITYCTNQYDVLKNADALVLVTEWNEFRNPDFDRIRSLLAEPLIFDGRNQYDPEEMKERGFRYYSIGRPSIQP